MSGFEMSQNAAMQKWMLEEVDAKLKATMEGICENVASTAKEYGVEGNYVDGDNIAEFKRVADAMMAEGYLIGNNPSGFKGWRPGIWASLLLLLFSINNSFSKI